jgi:hypothetical protein
MALRTETQDHIDRVQNDGGTVHDQSFTDDLIGLLLDEAIYSSLLKGAAVPAGTKEDGNGNISTLYDFTSNARDWTQDGSNAPPSLTDTSRFTQGKVAFFDGTGEYLTNTAFSDVSQPYTIAVFGQANRVSGDGYRTDGLVGEPRSALTSAKNTFAGGYAGNSVQQTGLKGVDEAGLDAVQFDGASSAIIHNGHKAVVTDVGTNPTAGVRLGSADGFGEYKGEFMAVFVFAGKVADTTLAKVARLLTDYYQTDDVWTDLSVNEPPSVSNPVLTKEDAGVDDIVADPILVNRNDQFYAFYEALGSTNGKTIDYATSPDGYSWTHQGQALADQLGGLSFPYIFESGGTTYMTPSTGDPGVNLFSATSFPDSWSFEQQLFDLSGSKDPVIIERNNTWYCFVGLGSKLGLFTSSSLTGTWSEHQRSPLAENSAGGTNDRPYESPAGGIIEGQNDLFLPVARRFNGADYDVSLLRITSLTSTEISLRVVPISALIGKGDYGTWTDGGMHQFDAYIPNSASDDLNGGFALVDGKTTGGEFSIGVLNLPAGSISGSVSVTDGRESVGIVGETKVSAGLNLTDLAESISLSGGSTITTGVASVTDRGEILSLEGQTSVNAISGTLSITNGRQSVSLSGTTKNEGTLNLTDRGERLVLLESEPPRLAVLDARLVD